MGRLQAKVAVVTGGGTGIGEAIARRFAEEGAAVAIFEKRRERGKCVEEVLCSQGYKARFYHVDVSDERQVEDAVESVVSEFGKLDILVNNAAITGSKNLTHELPLESWRQVFSVNVDGYFLCSKYALRHMVAARSGAIVNISSVYGLIGNSDTTPPFSAKIVNLSVPEKRRCPTFKPNLPPPLLESSVEGRNLQDAVSSRMNSAEQALLRSGRPRTAC